MSNQRPNIVFYLADQLRRDSLPYFGETQIQTPNIDRLAREGTNFTNMISTCPVCTPYRSMLLTGRHPQSTGHIINFVRTRHSEISIADAFSRFGYKTGWVGKWHLHTGSFPQINGSDYVPEGRDRLGFQFWRAYNFHMDYFNGTIHKNDWRVETWDGYETDALNRYAIEFMDSVKNDPFCLFLSPHQPHITPFKFAPDHYYERLPKDLKLPVNVPEEYREASVKIYRDYLAMTLAIDDAVGELYAYLERTGLLENTIFILSSDHGTQMGAQGIRPWEKKQPYEESIGVPFIIRWPGVFDGGRECDTLTAPVDIFPTLCNLCDIPIPRTVEGHDLSAAWLGKPGAFEQDALLMMNFTAAYDYLVDGAEWRGVRTKTHTYVRRLDGKTELYDLQSDPLEMNNLVGHPNTADLQNKMEQNLQDLMRLRGDQLIPCSNYSTWYDEQRRIIRNAAGELGDPETKPDWSLLLG